jgi:hypothetical protein
MKSNRFLVEVLLTPHPPNSAFILNGGKPDDFTIGPTTIQTIEYNQRRMNACGINGACGYRTGTVNRTLPNRIADV